MNKILTATLLLSSILYASELSHTLSNQGFTGLINTPNAQVMDEGDLTMHFNNQFDNVLRGCDDHKHYSYAENYIFGVGLFPYIEIQGRLAETPHYQRDLSANIKLQLPYKNRYVPNIALGLQDLGGAANHYGNKYIVLDKALWFLRASVGYGVSDALQENKKRMDGLFGGVEMQTFDWLSILAENDSREKFAALKLEMPKSWSSSFKLNSMVSTNLSDDYKTSFTVNVTFPLYENRKSYETTQNSHIKDGAVSEHKELLQKEKKIDTKMETSKVDKTLSLSTLREKLVQLGLENITIGGKDSTLYLAYENGVFELNDVDAMGVAIGLMSHTKYKKFVMEQKRSKIVVISLVGDLQKAKEFYTNPNPTNERLFVNSLQKVAPIDLNAYKIYVQNRNDSSFKPKIEIKPVVKTFVGNEFGLFTYMLWLRTQLQTNIYKGIDLTAVGDIHMHDSEIKDHRYDWFLKLYKRPSHMESLMLHANNNLFGGINTLSLGSFEERYAGAMEQYIYNYGNHTFKLKAGYFESFQDGDAYKEFYLGEFHTRRVALAKYSYYLDSLDMLSEIKLGQYWNQDVGFDVKLKRYFGDVAVYLAYEESTPKRTKSSLSESRDHFASMGIEIPLTLRHMPNLKYGQVKGTNAFDYRVKTTVRREDGTNSIVPSENYDPEVAISSENYFYNRNRLQLSYIKSHALRLKASFDKYAK